jgi:acyl-coenzyme A thioesterase PaaI-like protein
MSRSKPEPVQVLKQRRDAALAALTQGIPYAQFLGVRFERRGDELTALLPFDEKLIGNPFLPAIHGGVTSAFLEITAIIELSWALLWDQMEAGRLDPAAVDREHLPRLPKTIDFTVDYLRLGASARRLRPGPRSTGPAAAMPACMWKPGRTSRARLFAQATGHFLMPGALRRGVGMSAGRRGGRRGDASPGAARLPLPIVLSNA